MNGVSGLDVLSNDGILDIIPPSEYDPFEAKFCASLFWLVFHATEDGGLEDVPSQVTSPIQKLDENNGFVIHPEVVQFLTKGEVYCTVCTRIFPGKVALAGHWSVIQTLSRNGIYVVDGTTDIAVTDSSLEQTNPFHQGAHVALMDALMTAYSSQVVSIQSVVQAVRRFSTFSASRELPFDLEDALLLWVNKLTVAVNSKHIKPTPSNTRKLLRNRGQERKTELRADNSEETSSTVLPVIDDLLKGLCDGRCLLGVLLFYEPTVIKIEDICSGRVLSTDDSFRNLDLFRGLCSQYFCTSVLALKVEDILYGSPSLKINLVALLAEMFSKCEGNLRQGQEVQRSKTSCSDNGETKTNGYDESSTRSHSAPISRNAHISRSAQIQDKDISLKIQNFVENVGSSWDNLKSVRKPVSTENATSVTKVRSPAATDDVLENEDTVEVGGVVVKLRKKVPRNVEPGGGHEALLSRRMKQSLCSWSQEDVSTDTTPRTSDPGDQFDAKSDEVLQQIQAEPTDCSAEPEEAFSKTVDDVDLENLDLASPHSLELDLNTLPEAITPIDDLLSPISETTEPGSLGNSLNGSMTSPRDLHSPVSDATSVLRHEKNRGVGHERLTPPLSRTPRKLNGENHNSLEETSVPRGSYIISDASHTLESAVAAGIPVVERESLRMSGRNSLPCSTRSSDGAMLFRTSFPTMESSKETSELGLTGSSATLREEENSAREHPVINDQRRYSSENRWSDHDRRNTNRFSTFRKNKKASNEEELIASPQTEYFTVTRNGINGESPERKNDTPGSDPAITWFVQRKNESGSQKETISRNTEPVNHVSQRAGSDSGGKTTNWAMVADEITQNSEPVKKGFGQPGDKNEGVSRELNLLRLKLAEKQRDIEAQKQRTKEQLEEERKRVGQNVFWFAVGKGREKKETNGVKLSKESRDEQHIEPPLSNISKKTLHSSEVESSEDKKFITFTKQSSLDEELPPSMGKLQDRTYNLKPIDETLRGSNGNLTTDAEHGNLTTHAEHGKFTTGAEHGNLTTRAEHGKFTTGSEHGKITTGVEHSKITTGAEHGNITTRAEHGKITTGAEHGKITTRTEPSVTTPSQSSPRREETSVLPVKLSVSDRNLSEEVVHEFRLSRQTSGSEDSVLNKVQTKPEVLGNSNGFLTESEKLRAPVMNYKSRISVPLTYTTEPASENFSDVDGFGNPVGVHADEDSNQASSPPRKCWDMDSVNQDEPQLAVSKSNYHIFEQNSDGAGDYKNSEKTCGNDVPAGWIDQRTYTRNVDGGVRNYVPDGSEALGRLDDEVYVKKPMVSEKMLVDTKGSSPEGDPGRLEVNGNSPVSENDQDTPKKGLSLFIGQQNDAGEDGLTPEQIKKREKFLKSRLQKMEEEKIKKEAVLEKKRRKEEKMKEIQLRRDKEEHSRQTRLQEKKDQAEHAKQERQKYELQRKDNATRSHFVDGVPSGYPGYTRTDMNPHAFTPETSDVSTFGMNGPVVVPASPSAFSGFTGVQSYVKPSSKTNRKLIINAISHVCLPGVVNKDTKDKCLQTMTESSAQHFLILFREGLKFRGLYSLDPESNQVLKVHGVGPRSITEKMIHRLYKYNSGGKEFSELPAKGFSLSVDGFTLQKSCWQSNKPSVLSKTVSNYKQSSYRSTR